MDILYSPALKDMEGIQATTLENKKEMVRRVAFLRPPENSVSPPPPRHGIEYLEVGRGAVHRALYDQAQTKSPEPDLINFRTL